MKKKFGTFKGVFVPSTEAILGTVLFLLMPFLTADLGFLPMLSVILLAHTVTIATSFSLADCATNLNRIGGGGMYALSKLSLGNALGGSIGVQLYLAQAASVGFYCIGFAEPLQPLLQPVLDFLPIFQDMSPEGILIQKQLLATAFMVIFFLIVMLGADFTLKLQTFILVVLFLSIATIFVAPALDIELAGKAIFQPEMNLFGNRRLTMPIYFLTFTQFFPAVTGISTGIGMSGDLKDPRSSIVRGTFLAIFITLGIYIAAGAVFSFLDPAVLITGYSENAPVGVIMTKLFGLGQPFPANLPGLLVLFGVLFATCSSALSVFMTGPRTVQFLARDRILPKALTFLERDFRKGGDEPRWAILVTFFFGLAIIWMGNINFAAVVVGILFLVVYGWVNGAAFFERASRNPAFRPTFRGNWAVSLYGFLACIITICLFNWLVGLLVFLSQYVVFRLILKYRSNGKLEGVWWGVLFTMISRLLKSLQGIAQGTRNWRPVLISVLFCDNGGAWKSVGKLTRRIAAYQGWINVHAVKTPKKFDGTIDPQELGLPFTTVETADPTQAILGLIQAGFPGGISPNTILLEYTSRVDNVKILNTILAAEKNVLLLQNGEKLKEAGRLDIWWRGERNGNLMVLLAFIINRSLRDRKKEPYHIRVIRRLEANQEEHNARAEMSTLLNQARLEGEVIILPHEKTPFKDALAANSGGAGLIMMGLPGNYTESNRRLFRLNDFFFTKEIDSYDDLPPILFVKSNKVMDLLED